MVCTLVLVGAGHTHMQLVISTRLWPKDVRRILVSDQPLAVYSGMLPSVLSGALDLSCAELPVQALAMHFGWYFILGRLTTVCGAKQTLTYVPTHIPSTQALLPVTMSYDVLSINVGSVSRPLPHLCVAGEHLRFHDYGNVSETPVALNPAFATHRSSKPHVVYTRPIGKLVDRILSFEQTVLGWPIDVAHKQRHGIRVETELPCNDSTLHIVVIGAGAAGVELAFSLEARFRRTLQGFQTRISIVHAHHNLDASLGPSAASLVLEEFRRKNISLLLGRRACAIGTHAVLLDNGKQWKADLVVVATGAAPQEWMANSSDIQKDSEGFLAVLPSLRSKSLATVFAVGDCCSFDGHFGPSFPPRAGVYAVRMAPVLEHNIRLMLDKLTTGDFVSPFVDFVPQSSFLSLIATGDDSAIGSKWSMAMKSQFMFYLKLYIDKRWQRKFKQPLQPSSGLCSTGENA